jgi:hypothetical protein
MFLENLFKIQEFDSAFLNCESPFHLEYYYDHVCIEAKWCSSGYANPEVPERRIQNKSGVTVLVGVNEANHQLILIKQL